MMLPWIRAMKHKCFGAGYSSLTSLWSSAVPISLGECLLSKCAYKVPLVTAEQWLGRGEVWMLWHGCAWTPWCNPAPCSSFSFPRAVPQLTNNNSAVAGGKKHPCAGKFTSDWVGCLQTWKLDWGEQSRSCKLISFTEAVSCELSQLPGRRSTFKMGLIANLIMAARKLNWNMK